MQPDVERRLRCLLPPTMRPAQQELPCCCLTAAVLFSTMVEAVKGASACSGMYRHLEVPAVGKYMSSTFTEESSRTNGRIFQTKMWVPQRQSSSRRTPPCMLHVLCMHFSKTCSVPKRAKNKGKQDPRHRHFFFISGNDLRANMNRPLASFVFMERK